ncbi:PRC-barrel domain protein [Ancylobacter novellus DSM 506]|uniref:PRC-barrel domain protein n=1 Tax=Ancylobacter novellus (strain ATCC 8093 / DSM 506 / JCM 20403 / CCM 1077 / IAM 12100 / NBRC 12443 / NCIMB 10456) TaxID=639283 RepID=D7A522_ANCN5|nr:PRC-barrel domain-containing protein [Ancylobacter novellus]ADH89910.1 PRC-barrel domain protein [Ancylobacter novellus DSM 506]
MRANIIGLAAAAALLSAPALAQTPITETANVAVGPSDALASNLVGLDVNNAANEDVGEIEDLVLDSSMNAKGLVLSVGGFLGMGDRYVVVPPNAVKVTFDGSAKEWKGTSTLTREQLKAMPEFKYEGKFDD